MASIKGLQSTSLVDFPPYISATLFTSTCNFRCGYCHNKDLADDVGDEIPKEEILALLNKRKRVLDAVCITGGEPTLYKDLRELILEIRKRDYLVKLDTNGSNPDKLKRLLEENIIDYVAMDIKNIPERYDEVAGVNVNVSNILESIKIIKNSKIPYEFRMTVIPKHHDEFTFVKLAKLLKGSNRFVLQQYSPRGNLIDPSYKEITPYQKEDLIIFQHILKQTINDVQIRNI